MIARTWSATATAENAPAYAEHLRGHVVPELRRLPGYLGARLLSRATASGAEILVITYWHSLDAIRAFAGPDLERAVVADEARALLTRFDAQVQHHEVAVVDDVETPSLAT